MRATIVFAVVLILCCSGVYGVTLTFDEVPSGTKLALSQYAYDNRVSFSGDFRATDHTGFSWGPPRSGSNVLTVVEPYDYTYIRFGRWTFTYAELDDIKSMGAYFSTDWGAMVRITAYNVWQTVVTSMVIGAPGESWNNRYVEISTTPDLPFYKLVFEGVNSPDDLLGFCADDMTITPVPEPATLLALFGGLAGMGGVVMRRKG